MILIVGATGMVGGEVARLLRAARKPVTAMVRATSDPAKVANLKSLGVTTVVGDLRDSRSLHAACRGVTTVITTASSMPFSYKPGENSPSITDRDGSLSLITAATKAGVKQFIYTSFAPEPASFPLQDAKRAVEGRLRASGLTYTLLQPTVFQEVWLSPAVGFDYPNRKAAIYGSGDNAMSWISFLDVAQFAAASVDNPAARNATLPLGGPEGITPHQAVKLFEKACSKPFEVTHVPVEAVQAQLDAATDEMAKSFAGLMVSYASTSEIPMKDTLKLFPLKLRSVKEYAHSVMN